jgi:putative transposase
VSGTRGADGGALGGSAGVPRPPRDLVAGGVYHVYARGVRRLPIFVEAADRKQYLVQLGGIATDLRWSVLAYCLMDNHVHLLVKTPKPDLATGIKWLHGGYARYVNTRQGWVGHAFQGRYGCSRATSAGALWYMACYVVLNPVRAGMVATPEAYEWSSHAAAVGERPRPAWLDVEGLLASFDEGGAGLERYRQIVEAVRLMGAAGFEPATSRV